MLWHQIVAPRSLGEWTGGYCDIQNVAVRSSSQQQKHCSRGFSNSARCGPESQRQLVIKLPGVPQVLDGKGYMNPTLSLQRQRQFLCKQDHLTTERMGSGGYPILSPFLLRAHSL